VSFIELISFELKYLAIVSLFSIDLFHIDLILSYQCTVSYHLRLACSDLTVFNFYGYF